MLAESEQKSSGEDLDDEPLAGESQREDSKWIECQSQSMRVRGEVVSVS